LRYPAGGGAILVSVLKSTGTMSPRHDPLLHYLQRPSRRRLERVVRDYHEHVWKVAFRVTAHAEDAQDICQDVFLRLLLEPPAVADVRSPGGYLAWCVVGRAGKLRRAAERRLGREREAAARMVGREVSSEDAEAVRAELEKLPDDLRVPLELRYLAGLANADVASTLGLSPRTLEQRLHDGRERLKRRLAPLLLGVPAAVGAFADPATAAPPGLLPELLRVVRGGAAVSPTAASATGVAMITGGVVMTKKMVALAGALALLVASLAGSWAVLRDRSTAPAGEPVVAAPAAPAPAIEAAAVAEPPAVVVDGDGDLPPEPPRAGLRGVAKDEEGAVVVGATIHFFDNITKDDLARLQGLGYRAVAIGRIDLETTTDSSGGFHLDGLYPGRAHVGARTVSSSTEGYPAVELEAGREGWQLLSLRHRRRLSGRVSDHDGRTLPGAAVLIDTGNVAGREDLERVGQRDSDYVVFPTDAMGAFDTGPCLRSYPTVGGQNLLAWADGYAMSIDGQTRVGDAPYHGLIDFVLVPEMPVVLRVSDPEGKPLGGVEVGLGYTWIPDPLSTTDDTGRARMRHLESKKNSLRMIKEGFHTARVDVGPDGPREVAVTLERVKALDPELQPGAELTVRFGYEEPFPELSKPWGSLSLEYQPPNGAIERGLGQDIALERKPAQVVVRPTRSGRYRCWIAFTGGQGALGTTFDYDVRKPMTVEVRAALPRPHIAGVLVDSATKLPAPRQPVVAYHGPKDQAPQTWVNARVFGKVTFPYLAGSSRSCETDAAGRFLILLPREECRLAVSVRVDEVRVGWAAAEELELGADDRVTDLRLELRPGGAIEGQVVDATGAPVPGETIAAYDGGANLDRKISDAEGRFRFTGLRPGNYALEALGVLGTATTGYASGTDGFEPGLLDPGDVFERRISVREGETTSWTIVLERDRLGAIEGVLEDGLPRTGMVEHVVLVDETPRRVRGWHGGTEVSAGSFRIPTCHAGRYRVTFRAPGIVAEATAEVRRGHVARVALRPASGRLWIPLPAIAPEVAAELKLTALERRDRPARRDEKLGMPCHWEEWAVYGVERREGGLEFTGLPTGIWRAKVESPHLPDAWTEPASVQDGFPTEAPVLVFSKPCTALVRCELDDGSPVAADARLVVFDPRGGVTCRIEVSPDDPALRRLTKLPAGDFTAGVEWQGRGAEAPLAVREDSIAEVRLVVPRP
jgi:RNA polymerase sigma-70 factor (ECF subfamily)